MADLKPEVREAVEYVDEGLRAFGTSFGLPAHRWQTIRAELVRLAGIEANAVGDREDADFWKGRAERAESELAALKARIAEAPTAVVKQFYANLTLEPFDPPAWALRDKPVRLLLDAGESA